MFMTFVSATLPIGLGFNMITYKFYVGKDVYEFTAESKLSAMEMCNRQVIDKLDLHPMAWFDAGQNAFSCQSGNFFD
jgi:hypothetical protein